MANRNGTCTNCEDRRIWTDEAGVIHTCHQTCEKYIEYQNEKNQLREKILAQKNHENWLDQCGKERSEKYRKKMGIKKRR